MLRDYMAASAKPETPLRTTNVMSYELGGIIRGLIYAEHKRAQGDVKGMNAHIANARVGHADLLVQLQLLAEQMGWDMVDQENDGMERFRERMTEIKTGVI